MNTTLARAAHAALNAVTGNAWRSDVIQRCWDAGAPSTPPQHFASWGAHEAGWQLPGGQWMVIDWLREAADVAIAAATATGAQVDDGTPVPGQATLRAGGEHAILHYVDSPLVVVMPGGRRYTDAAQILVVDDEKEEA